MKINQTYVRLSVSFHSFLCLIGIVCPEVEMINFELELMLKRDRHRGKKGGMWECGWARTLSNCAALYHRCVCVCVCVCAMWRVCRIDFPLWHACHVMLPAARPPRHVVPAAAAAAPADISWPPFLSPLSLPPSLCRVFCNGFHAGRLARPA